MYTVQQSVKRNKGVEEKYNNNNDNNDNGDLYNALTKISTTRLTITIYKYKHHNDNVE